MVSWIHVWPVCGASSASEKACVMDLPKPSTACDTRTEVVAVLASMVLSRRKGMVIYKLWHNLSMMPRYLPAAIAVFLLAGTAAAQTPASGKRVRPAAGGPHGRQAELLPR
jgi:hypothetical protein